jgi:SpoVK/Ycf46/Vps4 family AAA+-type ATPase
MYAANHHTGELNIEDIEEVDWNVGAFQRLVLDGTKKELIEALISEHLSTSDSTDIIEGKGNGLVMLLHGGPGTGKTLTAESIAELTKKPLYRVTCGDIGTSAEEVEKYLETVFDVGTGWDCVVLLDEADVFLEERTQTDLQRNALVSAFLRTLEYYSGILILTSNRVGTFDEAFKSRMQLAVHYPDLDVKSRRKIWAMFINQLDPSSANIEVLRENLDSLAESELNGREIRNTVKTARQLANYRKRPLDYTHFERVLKVANDFEDYLVRTKGHTSNDFAKSQNWRS